MSWYNELHDGLIVGTNEGSEPLGGESEVFGPPEYFLWPHDNASQATPPPAPTHEVSLEEVENGEA